MDADAPEKIIVYEFPLVERIRFFLRYETLIEAANRRFKHKDDIATLQSLNRLLLFIGNHDLKRELLHQLEQQNEILSGFSKIKGADQEKLSQWADKNSAALERFYEFRMPSGDYRNHHFLASALRQLSLQSGISSFDFPELLAWRQLPWEQRGAMLAQWLEPLRQFAAGVDTCLELTRQSGDFAKNIAKQGYYSMNPANSSLALQMVRIRLPAGTSRHPIVSTGAQMLTVHFMEPGDFSDAPARTSEDVEFDMAYCVM